MWQESGGNAMYVRQLVEGALDAGTLREMRGVWQLRGRPAVTAELVALLGARIDQMSGDVVRALRLLTFCEPLDLSVMIQMVGDDAVEQAVANGLIRVVDAGGRCEVRFNHPLFAEVMRRRLGVAAARRVRGELVRALRANPIRGPAERIRLAELMRESDVAPDVELMVAAATDAIELTNVTLCEQLARTAVDCGGGLPATLLLSRSLAWQGRAAEAEQCLDVFNPDTMTEIELLWWGAARLINLQLSMGDADSAEEVLGLLPARASQRLSGVVDALAAASLAVANRLTEAAELAWRAITDPLTVPPAVGAAVYGGVMALGLMGRGDEALAVAGRGRVVANQTDGMMRYSMGFAEVQALVLRGDFDAAEERLEDTVGITSSGQYLAWDGQPDESHGRTRSRPVCRRGVAHGADGRRDDHRVGRVVELPATGARAVKLRTGPQRCGRGIDRRIAIPLSRWP